MKRLEQLYKWTISINKNILGMLYQIKLWNNSESTPMKTYQMITLLLQAQILKKTRYQAHRNSSMQGYPQKTSILPRTTERIQFKKRNSQ